MSGKVTKLKGPLTKRPLEEKPDREPLADDSDVNMEVGSDYRPLLVDLEMRQMHKRHFSQSKREGGQVPLKKVRPRSLDASPGAVLIRTAKLRLEEALVTQRKNSVLCMRPHKMIRKYKVLYSALQCQI